MPCVLGPARSIVYTQGLPTRRAVTYMGHPQPGTCTSCHFPTSPRLGPPPDPSRPGSGRNGSRCILHHGGVSRFLAHRPCSKLRWSPPPERILRVLDEPQRCGRGHSLCKTFPFPKHYQTMTNQFGPGAMTVFGRTKMLNRPSSSRPRRFFLATLACVTLAHLLCWEANLVASSLSVEQKRGVSRRHSFLDVHSMHQSHTMDILRGGRLPFVLL